jgi:predicted metal-dependent phosphoesterase TrpH
MNGIVRAELHCHTYRSGDSLLLPAAILERCRRMAINRVAITDHNTIAGAREAAALDPERVIVGEEIMTTAGEILAYYVREEVPPGLTPSETIARLRAQGAMISVAHPFDRTRPGGWSEADLEGILGGVDALEVYNARTWSEAANRQAGALAARAGLMATAGSDAHAGAEIGRVMVVLPAFRDAATLRAALAAATIAGRRSSPLVHLFSRYAVWRKRWGWHPARPRQV